MKTIRIFSLIALVASISLVACEKEYAISEKDPVYNDALASPNPELDFTNIFIPNPTFSSESGNIVRMDMAGILSPETKEWLELIGTSTTTLRAGSLGEKAKVYVEIDGKPKYLDISFPNPTDENNLVDYVFLVDNSGSMSEEADAVADEIVEYAKYLSKEGLDIRFGCVGYDDYGYISGAIDMTDSIGINSYLNRGYTGTNRTKGFSGANAITLQSAASNYQHTRGECGSVAFRYADENLDFRKTASIYYVNFTDEPNQPTSVGSEWSIEWAKTNNMSNWKQKRGTIHTVFSGDTTFSTSSYEGIPCEKPWLMSEYTGGTTLFTDPSFTTIRSGGTNLSASLRANGHISLTALPVTGAMVNSHIIRFKNTSTVPDGEHKVKITIQSADKSVQGEKVLRNVTFGNSEK